MDTVTESQMAITIAQLGGMGILHKNMDIDLQTMQVRRVEKIWSRYGCWPYQRITRYQCWRITSYHQRKQNQRCACGRR